MADSSPKNDESFPVISKDVSKTISSNIDTQKFSVNKTIIQVKTNEINDRDDQGLIQLIQSPRSSVLRPSAPAAGAGCCLGVARPRCAAPAPPARD